MKKFVKIFLALLFFVTTSDAQNIFQRFGNWVVEIGKPVHGEFKVGGKSNTSTPLIYFDRNLILIYNLNNLKDNIALGPNEARKQYKVSVFDRATLEVSSDCDDGSVCQNAEIAKCAAFVFMLNLDDAGNPLPTTGDFTREKFREKAVKILKELDTKDGWFPFLGAGRFGFNKLQRRSKELIMYLQAYETLRTAKDHLGISPFGSGEEDKIKEKLITFTKQLYERANNFEGALDTYSNYSLMCSGALGLSACIFANEGTYFWKVASKPMRWGNAANAYINATLFGGSNNNQPIPMTSATKHAGYAEGPHYFIYAFENLLPYFQAYYNFLDGQPISDKFQKSLLSLDKEKVYNFLLDDRYDRLYEWYQNITLPNGEHPTYDDSWIGSRKDLLALTWKKKYDVNVSKTKLIGIGSHINAFPDYLVATTNWSKQEVKLESKSYVEAGNYILRSSSGKELKDKHYLHVLGERNESLNGGVPHAIGSIKWGHQHQSLGSIILSAGEDILLMDPAYFGEEDKELVNQGPYHNIITIDDGPHAEDECAYGFLDARQKSVYVKLNYWNRALGIKVNNKATVERNVEVIQDDPKAIPYYILTDLVKNLSNQTIEVAINFAGNGNKDDNPSTFTKIDDNTCLWSYPCTKDNYLDDNYKLYLESKAVTGLQNNIVFTDQSGFYNGNNKTRYVEYPSAINNNFKTNSNGNFGIINTSKPSDPGQHTNFKSPSITLSQGSELTFHTVIEPVPCYSSGRRFLAHKSTPKVNGYLMSAGESIYNIHFSKPFPNSDFDTIFNPFNLDTNDFIITNGYNGFVNYASNSMFKIGSCESDVNIRKFGLKQGSYLNFNDTILLESNNHVNAWFEMIGKCKYQVNIISELPATVKIYLPDVLQGQDFKMEGYQSNYDTATHIIEISITDTVDGIIELSDPCLVSCYFPPTEQRIDSTFLFSDGTHQNLSHKLDIVQPYGLLEISNNSKMEISCHKYLRNRDSLILLGACGADFEINYCDLPSAQFKSSPLPGIIVAAHSSLVLDSGSFTSIGNNSAIVVKSGASLIIKDSAILQIGDGVCGGYGFITAEPGSNVYIQPGAKILFHKTIGDTVDRHKFYIALFPNHQKAFAGVDSLNLILLKSDTILSSPLNPAPIPFCDLNRAMTPAVHNNEFGYATFMPVVPKLYLRNDTLCAGEPLIIDLRRILNDNKFWFEVCRLDSIFMPPVNGYEGFWMDTCLVDTMSYDSNHSDPGCMPPQITPDWFIYYFKTHSNHRVTIRTGNDCSGEIDSIIYIHVLDSPRASVTVPKVSCPGIGSVQVITQSDYEGRYAWYATLVDTAGSMPLYYRDNQNESISYSLDSTGLLPDTFNFPGFNFLGGRKYLITLRLTNVCGNLDFNDTVAIPFGAYINFERPTVYANPVHGARTVQLHGYVNSADSFSWSPPTWLNRTDTLVVISTPEDSISYVLTAYQGSCVAYDTAFIKYNRVANAGLEDTVCYTSTKVLLGNGYDLSVFLGYLYYKGGSDFRDNWFLAKTTSDHEYFKYLSLFMQTNYFKTWMQNTGNLYLDFTLNLKRAKTIQESWFISYFESLTAFDNADMSALDFFVGKIDDNTELRENYTSTGHYGPISGNLNDFFSLYDDFVVNHLNTISMSWIKVTGIDTSFNGSLQESAIAIDEPTRTTTYIQQVITPDYAEIDETIVYVDTIPTIAFAVQLQFDSTVIFENYTEPTDGSNRYSWNFGDGSATSNQVHPYHTFPAFDTLFRVCLTATNDCGSYTWCDTVYIDSAHWGGGMRLWGEGEREGERETEGERVGGGGIEAFVYPNPTEGNTTLAYRIQDDAKLLITDAQGKLVWQTELKANSQELKANSSLLIPSQNFANGLYFYTLQSTLGSARGKIVVHR